MTLDRFVEAQQPIYDQALEELRQGDKRSHWMWFVFPQLAGLGRSPTSQHFGLAGRQEAVDYLDHPVLGARLRECALVLLGLDLSDPVDVLGTTDALKLRSSMTLFAAASDDPVFGQVLEKYYEGPDPLTIELLQSSL